MADALVSPVVEQLVSIMARELEQEVRLVVGVENAVDQLTSNLTAIKAVLADAETRQVKEATVRDWLEKLRDVAYDIEDVLDDWEAAILSSQSKPGDEQDPKKPERKVCSFLRSSCFCCKQIGQRHDIARKIKELNERLDRIAQERYRYHFDERENNPPIERPMTTSLIDITEVEGREEDKNVLVEKLVSEPSDGDGPGPQVLSIVGMGGIGKTTLAQYAFNHDRIKAHFGNNKFWVCVSDPFDETRVAKAILTRLRSPENVTESELEDLHQKIGESVKDKKFVLVLDDVWEENSTKWNRLKQSLKFGLSGSKILVTTRNERVASIMGCSKNNILSVKKLSDEKCWLIISKIAFFDGGERDCKNLEGIGREISTKCNGLPLAAKALGGNLRFRRTKEEWESILNSEIWELEEAQREIIPPLWLSYWDLSPALKRCFSYCAIFPKDHVIKKKMLIKLWMVQGYVEQGQTCDIMEVKGENYFQNLVMRSFFQDFEKDKNDDQMIYSCKMHDMVHDLAQFVARNECVTKEVNGPAESIIGPLSSSKVRHLRLDCTSSTPSFKSFDGAKKLRSLFIWGSLPPTEEELSRLFSESTRVRSLSLGHGGFAEIPPCIRKLVQLRWLDLSLNSRLKQLPETLCELQSLQTIDVSHCYQLEQLQETLCELHSLQTIDVTECRRLLLPDGIGKLINLRHLHNRDSPTRLPKGIGELTGLRTLEVVDLGLDENAFSLGDLKNLNQLRGSLEIYDLGAYNGHVGEAKQAELKKKEHITLLRLAFAFPPYKIERSEEESLLEALEPSPDLEILRISNYDGTTFPGWLISLTNLRSICLESCGPCKHLPSLGKLPSLETLYLWQCDFKKVGLELLGIKTRIGDNRSEIQASSSASSSSSPEVVAFPKLKRLSSSHMENWEEWEDYHDGTAKPPAVNIMPSLRSLEFILCPRLKALPDYILQSTTLDRLYISGCRFLEERYGEEGKDRSKISHIPDVKIY